MLGHRPIVPICGGGDSWLCQQGTLPSREGAVLGMIWVGRMTTGGGQKLVHEVRGSISGCQTRQMVQDWKHPNPSPPAPTGRVTCSQEGSSWIKLILVIKKTMAIVRWSQYLRRGEKGREVRRMCWSLGMENELQMQMVESFACQL